MSRRCPTCGAEVVSSTDTCPRCGASLKQGPDKRVAETTIVDSPADTIIAPSPEPTEDDGATVRLPNLADTDEDERTVVLPDTTPLEDEAATRVLSETASAMDDEAKTRVLPDTAAPAPTATVVQADTVTTRPDIPVSPAATFKTGHLLQNRYLPERMLGKGGFGAVYLAQDVKLKRACVVKQMLIPPDASREDIEIYRANFEREASLLVQLNHPGHPSIPEIYDYFSDASGNYLVMKYIEGQSLQDLLEQSAAKLLWREAVRYIVDVCDALHYMHTIGDEPVMHRDIKPANILLGTDKRVWLVDFGLAKATPMKGSGGSLATQSAGSLGYTPLEQWRGKATPASDIYALGATLYHLVTGQSPSSAFQGEFYLLKIQELHGQFPSIREADKNLPEALDAIIHQAVAPNPADRPTAQQLKQQLETLISVAQGAALFTFKSGESANTPAELVDLCERYREEAEEYLYNGNFERWFIIINRNDLAAAAAQAVKQGKNRRDGLERFLKLLVPHLFWRRLGRAAWKMSLAAVQVILIFLVAVLAVLIVGSYGLRWLIQQSIAAYPWNYYALDLDHENHYSEVYLNQVVRAATRAYLQHVQIDLRAPDRLEFSGNLAGLVQLDLPVRLEHHQNRPYFYISRLNDLPLYLIGDNITQGINRGIDAMFARAPIDIADLRVTDDGVYFTVAKSGRVPWSPPPTPVIPPTPTPTPTPEGVTLLAVFNELGQDITLQIGDQQWVIPAHDSKAIELWPGTYRFTARYSNGQIAARGQKTWTARAYKWRIRLLPTPTPVSE